MKQIHKSILIFLGTSFLLTFVLLFLFHGHQQRKDSEIAPISEDSGAPIQGVSLSSASGNPATRVARKPLPTKGPVKKGKKVKAKKYSIQVFSTLKRPISGAQVNLLSAGRIEAQGVTNAEGKVLLSFESRGSPLIFLVKAKGFGLGSRSIQNKEKEYIFYLAQEGKITGRVQSPLGVPLEGMRIYALPKGFPKWQIFGDYFFWDHPIPMSRLRSMIPQAISNKNGFFVLTGLDPKDSYTLVGGGKGWVSLEDSLPEVRSGSSAQLVFWKLYGRIVKAYLNNHRTPPEGIDFNLDSEPVGAGSRMASLIGYTPKEPDMFSFIMPFSGLSIPRKFLSFDRGVDWRKACYFLALKSDQLKEVSLETTYRVTGYKVKRFSIHLLPLKRIIPEQEVHVSMETQGFGQLILVYEGSLDPRSVNVETRQLFHTFGKLHLVCRTGSYHANCPLFNLWGPPTILQVPYGRYHVSMTFPTGWGLLPVEGKELRVGPDPVKLHWDLRRSAALLLKPNHLPPGILTVDLLDRNRRIKRSLYIEGPPFYLPCLWEGDFDFKLKKHLGNGKYIEDKVSNIHLKASEIREVECFK